MTLLEYDQPDALASIKRQRLRQRPAVKVSTTLPQADVDFIKYYAEKHELPSHAVAYQAAVKALRNLELMRDYEEADKEWYESGEAALWECTVGDGIDDEP